MSKKNYQKKYLGKATKPATALEAKPQIEKSQTQSIKNQNTLYSMLRTVISSRLSFLLLLVGLSIVLFAIFSDYIFMYKALLFRGIGSDTITTFYPNYLNHYHATHTETAGVWSFWMGMGYANNPVYSYLNLLHYLFEFINSVVGSDLSKVPFLITYQVLAVIALLGVTSYGYLQLLNLNKFSALIGSLLLSFSGFVMVGSGWHHYPFTAFTFILLLFSFELLLVKRVWVLIPFAVMTCGGFGMYLYFHIVFLFFYSLFRFIDVHGFKPKQLAIMWFTMLGLGIVGVGLTASGIVSTYFTLVDAPRFAGNSSSLAPSLSQLSIFSFENNEVLNRGIQGNHYITALFRMFSPDILGTGAEYVGWNNYLEGPNFYVGLISLLLLPNAFIHQQGFRRWMYAGFLALWILPVIFPYFRHAFHLFVGDYYKMTFNLYIPLVILFFSMTALTDILKNRKINIWVIGITWLVLMIILFSDFYPENIKAINTEIRNVAALLLTLYVLLIYSLQNRTISVYSKYLIYLLVIFELSFFGYKSLNDRKLPGTNQSAIVSRGELRLRNGYNDYTIEALEYIKKLDSGFYRMEKDYQSGDALHGSLNDAMAQGYFGTASYSSFQDMDYVNFLAAFELINPKNEAETRWIRGLRGSPLLMHWAGVKYFLSSPVQTDPAFPSSSYLQMGYDSLTQFYDVKVLKSMYALPLGFTYNKVIKETEFLPLKKELKESVLLKYLIIKDNDSSLFSDFQSVSATDTAAPIRTYEELAVVMESRKGDSIAMLSFKQDLISYQITTNKPEILFFTIPHHVGWQAFIDEKEVQIIKSNIGFMSVLLPAGTYKLDMKFTPYLFKESVLVQTGFELLYGVLIVFFFVSEFKRRRKQKQNTGNENQS